MMRYLSLFLLALLTSCASTSATSLETRQTVHDLRVGLEPILDEVVTRQADPDLADTYANAKAVADAIAIAWDAYLETESDGDRIRLVAALNAGLDAADQLVPLLTEDDDKAFYALSTIAILKVVVLQVARSIDEEEVAEAARG